MDCLLVQRYRSLETQAYDLRISRVRDRAEGWPCLLVPRIRQSNGKRKRKEGTGEETEKEERFGIKIQVDENRERNGKDPVGRREEWEWRASPVGRAPRRENFFG